MHIYPRIEQLRTKIMSCKKCTKAVAGTKNFPFEKSFDWIPNEVTILFLAHEPPNSDNYFYTNPQSMFTKTLLKLLFKANLLSREDLEDFVIKGFYLTDISKCHRGEPANCGEFLKEEIELLKPEIVCTLGRNALSFVLKNSDVSFKDIVGGFIDKALIKEEYQRVKYFFSCYFPLTAPVRNEVRIRHFENLWKILSTKPNAERD